jgi:hypothetical protein
MQFDDIRGMLKLPLPEVGIKAGCNFSAAAMLCNLISGISVVLYTPKNKNIGSGKRFRELLKEYYPWEDGENRQQKSEIIYDFIRNPLAHSLGVLKRGSLPIAIHKDALTEEQIEEMEKSYIRPSWVPFAVKNNPKGDYILSVWGLYWGVFHLVGNLTKDTGQMQEAEKRFLRP